MMSSAYTPTTALTSGPLRLTFPTTARIPSLNLRPGSNIVDVSLTNFTGTLTFELVSHSESCTPTFSPPLTQAPYEQPSSQKDEPPRVQSQPVTASESTSGPVPATCPAFVSQPLPMSSMAMSMPMHSMGLSTQSFDAAPISDFPSVSAGLNSNSFNPNNLLPSTSPAASTPFSMLKPLEDPLASPMPATCPRTESFVSSRSVTSALFEPLSPSRLNDSDRPPRHAMPESQFPDSIPASQADGDSQTLVPCTPPMPHFAGMDDVPESPPITDDEEEDNQAEKQESPEETTMDHGVESNSQQLSPTRKSQRKYPSLLRNIHESKKMKGNSKLQNLPHPSALAKVDIRPHKHGKRVRFDENPVFVGSPPLKRLAFSSSNGGPSTPPRTHVESSTPAISSSQCQVQSGNDSPVTPPSKRIEESPPLSPPSSITSQKKLSPIVNTFETVRKKINSSKAKTSPAAKKASLASPASSKPAKESANLAKVAKDGVVLDSSVEQSSPAKSAMTETDTDLEDPNSPTSPIVASKTITQSVFPTQSQTQAPFQTQVPSQSQIPTQLLTPAPTCTPGQGSPWVLVETTGAGQPLARWGATLTALDHENVLLVGGESSNEELFRDAVIYNVSEQKWVHDESRPPAMPCSRAWHSSTRLDDVLFVFGGESGNGNADDRQQTNEALVYDRTYRTWYKPSINGTPPSARGGHCAALIPNTRNIAVFGGIHGNKWMNDFHILEDLCEWKKVRLSTTRSAKPSARSYASLTPAAGFLVLFGGNNKSKCFNDVHFFVNESAVWIEPVVLGRSPKPRTGHCAVASKDGKSVIVYGGWDDQGKKRIFYSDVWALRIESQTECHWTCIYAGNNAGSTPGPRAGAAICGGVGKDKEETILFGGWHQIKCFNDITRLEVAANGRVRACSSR